MDDFFQKIIYSLGGGIATIILFMTFFKQLGQKYLEIVMETSAEKTIKKLENRLAKNLSAFEMLLNKEFEFYTKVDTSLSDIIVQIQDFSFYLQNKEELERSIQCKKAKSKIISVLKVIPIIKSYILTYQAYVPKSVFSVTSDFIVTLQEDINDMYRSLESLCLNKISEIDYPKIDEIEKKTLMNIALIRLRTQQRLSELANEKVL